MKLIIKTPFSSKEYPLEEGVYIVGRSSQADIQLDENDRTASRRHGKFFSKNKQFYYEDIGSTDGSKINGANTVGQVALQNGDILALGKTTIEIVLEVPAEEDCTIIRVPAEDNTEVDGGTVLDDSTEIFNVNSDDYLKLIAVHPAEAKRKEFVLNKDRMTIGRVDADIILKDKSVSNPHAVIFKQRGVCWLHDEKSTNGTFVNNSKIAEKHLINIGDNIKIGRYSFVLTKSDAVYEDVVRLNQTASSRSFFKYPFKKKIYYLPVAGIIMSAVGLSLYLKYSTMQTVGGTVQASSNDGMIKSDVPSPPLKAKKQSDDFSVYSNGDSKEGKEFVNKITVNTGDDFFANQMWEDAIEKYKEVLMNDPDFPEVKNKMIAASNELKNKTIFIKEMKELQDGKLAEAKNTMNKIERSSIYYVQSLEQIEKVSQEIAENKQAAKEAAEEEAKRAAAQAAKEEAKRAAMQAATQAAKEEAKRAAAQAAKEEAKRAAAQAAKEEEKIIKDIKSLFKDAEQNYLTGNLNFSIANLNKIAGISGANFAGQRSRAQKTMENIKRIADLYLAGEKFYQNNQLEESVKQWKELLDLEERTFGRTAQKSYLKKKISIHTADQFYQKAHFALSQGNKEKAIKCCKIVLEARPDHQECLQIIRQ